MRNRRMSLTMGGGILFGGIMLILVFILVIMLFKLPDTSPKELTKKGTVYAQVLPSSDIRRLEAGSTPSSEPTPSTREVS